MGRRSRLPVYLFAGIATPANVTAPIERSNSGVDSLNTEKEAAIMAQISVYGRLMSDPQEGKTPEGKAMTVSKIAVNLPMKNGEHRFLFSMLAFGKQAGLLARHRKGDLVSTSGSLALSAWKGREGEERKGLQIVLDTVISARTVKSED